MMSNKKLEEAWNKAEATGEPVDIGDIVVCDICSKDFTESDAVGGFLFGSKGVCPDCSPKMLKSILSYQEEGYIKARAEPGESFKAFIMRIRGGNNTVRVRKY